MSTSGSLLLRLEKTRFMEGFSLCYWTMGFDPSGQEARKASRVNSSFSETLWERHRIISQISAENVNAHNHASQI